MPDNPLSCPPLTTYWVCLDAEVANLGAYVPTVPEQQPHSAPQVLGAVASPVVYRNIFVAKSNFRISCFDCYLRFSYHATYLIIKFSSRFNCLVSCLPSPWPRFQTIHGILPRIFQRPNNSSSALLLSTLCQDQLRICSSYLCQLAWHGHLIAPA